MNKPLFVVSLCILLSANLSSCHKTVSSIGQNSNDSLNNNFPRVFEKFWDGVNNNYIYWNIDTTNWTGIYNKYQPIFAHLDISKDSDAQSSVTYFRQMTQGLTDNHFQIVFTNHFIPGTVIYPAADRKQRSPDFHFPYDYAKNDIHYFDSGYVSAFDSVTEPNVTPLHVMLATINRTILYFNCNKFSLASSYQSPVKNSIKPVLDSLFTSLNNIPSIIKGIIIDVRNNYGGNLSDLNFLAGHFIDQPLHFGYSRYKAGIGRLDYTPWINTFITPQQNARRVNCPIIVLTDNFSVSLAETIAMAIHALPNGIVIGEITWGATGPLTANEVYNDGQFSIPGFMTVYTSSAEFKYIDNKMYEGIGFPPDIPIPFNPQALQAGNDPALEKAIQSIP